MTADANLILVGFMGTGKSAAGARLATRLGRELVEMDAVIESRERRSIPAIFRDSGERYFRSVERALVRELSARRNLVVSTGGGVVLDPANIADFQSTGVVICLEADPEVILRRVAGDDHRPLLQDPDPGRRIRELLAARAPLYAAIPDRIDTSTLTLARTTETILDLFRRRIGEPFAALG